LSTLNTRAWEDGAIEFAFSSESAKSTVPAAKQPQIVVKMIASRIDSHSLSVASR
jgi:hypothetical protein